jgi:hypothetical protein
VTSSAHRAIARAEITLGRLLGVGGGSWTITRTTGEGVSAAPTPTSVGTWAGYVADERVIGLEIASPGTPVGAKNWYGVAVSASTPLIAGDTLASAEDTTIRYRVAAVDRVTGYARYILEPL